MPRHAIKRTGGSILRSADAASSKRIAQFREVTVKVVNMLAERSIKVTQQGTGAYVKYRPDGTVEVVNLPYIPDTADEVVLNAIRGFLDHEVAHVLFTDGAFRVADSDATAASDSAKVAKKIHTLYNILEDTRIEREMQKRFPGSASNMVSTFDFVVDRDIRKSATAAKDAGNQHGVFLTMLMPLFRAWSGQDHAARFVQEMGGEEILGPVLAVLLPFKDRIPTLSSTQDAVALAKEIYQALKDAGAPPPEQTPEPEESEETEDSDEAAESDGGQGESEEPGTDGDEPEASEDPTTPEQDDKKESDQEEPESKKDQPADDGDDTDENGENEEEGDEDESESEETPSEESDSVDGEPGSKPEDNGSDGDDSDDDQSDDSDSPGSDSDSSGDEDADGDEAGDEAGEDDQETSGSESEAEDGAVDPTPDQSDEEADVPDNSEPEAPETEPMPQDGEVTSDSGAIRQSTTELLGSLDEEDVDRISKALTAALRNDLTKNDYLPFSTDFDTWETVECDPKFIPAIDKAIMIADDKMRSMVGQLQSHMRRMLAQQAVSVAYGGQRSGRIQSSALHKLLVGDDRVFFRREEHGATDTAVTLLVDCSGSMRGLKIKLACEAAYALGQTLERLNINCEIVGFTTREELPPEVEQRIYDEQMVLRRQFSRVSPIRMFVFKSFDERLIHKVRQRIIGAGGCGDPFRGSFPSQITMRANVDGESVMLAARRLMKQREQRKILIALSDGDPSATAIDSHIEEHLRQTVQDCEDMGIETLGIGIMSESVRHYYPKHVILHDIEKLSQVVITELKKFLVG